MSANKDQAISLRIIKYSETSQIVTLFGRNSGRIRAIAKGARKAKSKFDGGLDLLTAGNVVYYPSRSGDALATLGEFEITESFSDLRTNLLALYCSQFAAEILTEFTEDFDPHPNLYDVFRQTLHNLTHADRPDVALLSFQLTLLQEIGLSPVWTNCTLCRQTVPADQTAQFSSNAGGVVCKNCQSKTPKKQSVKPQVLNLLQNPQNAAATPPHTIVDAHVLLCYHQCELIGRPLKTMSLAHTMLRKFCAQQ